MLHIIFSFHIIITWIQQCRNNIRRFSKRCKIIFFFVTRKIKDIVCNYTNSFDPMHVTSRIVYHFTLRVRGKIFYKFNFFSTYIKNSIVILSIFRYNISWSRLWRFYKFNIIYFKINYPIICYTWKFLFDFIFNTFSWGCYG